MRSILLPTLIGLLGTSASAQSTLRVPSQFPTVQSAIDAAVNGDTVLVADGTYDENINYLGKSITVTSENGPTGTILDGGQRDSVVTMTRGEPRSSILEGFTIRNGFATESGGVKIRFGSPTIRGNVITRNRAGVIAGGVSAASSSALIEDNHVFRNRSVSFGGAMILRDHAQAVVRNNLIEENNAARDGGGMYLFAAGTPLIQDNVFRSNTTSGSGGSNRCSRWCRCGYRTESLRRKRSRERWRNRVAEPRWDARTVCRRKHLSPQSCDQWAGI